MMAVHNIPEGLAMTAALKLGRTGWRKIICALLLVEAPMGLGAFFGGFLGRVSAEVSASALGFAAGAMFLLVFLELLPVAGKITPCRSVLAAVAAGLFFAFLLAKLTG